ncbi:MAG: CRISPR system precrRNA processing endoribonuclease RAMP protein Cas6 [Thermodesulforhabdaceae bacterium]
MDSKAENFPILRLAIEIKADTPLEIPPYPGSTLRGTLGGALKKICCISKQQTCDDCLIKSSCIYVYVFETPMLTDSSLGLRFRHAPHPFVLDVPVEETKVLLKPGDTWSFGITVFGQAITWLPYVVAAVEKMGQLGIGRGRGKFQVNEIWSIDENGKTTELIYSDGTFKFPEKVLNLQDLGKGKQKLGNGRFRLTFMTPLRLQFRGELVNVPEFHILVGNLLQRISLVVKVHSDMEFPDLSKEFIPIAREVKIVENNTSWYDWRRYSHRQGKKMPFGGIIGSVIYEGDPSLFEPYLSAGTIFHVGKNTGFGLGRYEWEYV